MRYRSIIIVIIDNKIKIVKLDCISFPIEKNKIAPHFYYLNSLVLHKWCH